MSTPVPGKQLSILAILWLIHVIYSPIYFKVVSLTLGQPHDYPVANEATLKDMG